MNQRISKEEYRAEIKKLASLKDSMDHIDFCCEEFDLLIDHKIGIYTPEELRNAILARFRKMKEEQLVIDEKFSRLEIDADTYCLEVTDTIHNMAWDVNDMHPNFFSESTFRRWISDF